MKCFFPLEKTAEIFQLRNLRTQKLQIAKENIPLKYLAFAFATNLILYAFQGVIFSLIIC